MIFVNFVSPFEANVLIYHDRFFSRSLQLIIYLSSSFWVNSRRCIYTIRRRMEETIANGESSKKRMKQVFKSLDICLAPVLRRGQVLIACGYTTQPQLKRDNMNKLVPITLADRALYYINHPLRGRLASEFTLHIMARITSGFDVITALTL
jgi:hypothetical protein